jgi:hypothetical protein
MAVPRGATIWRQPPPVLPSAPPPHSVLPPASSVLLAPNRCTVASQFVAPKPPIFAPDSLRAIWLKFVQIISFIN